MAHGKRIRVLDEVRGLCVLLMVVFHGFYTVGYLLDLEIGRRLFAFFMPAEPWFAGLFILICGFSCTLSRSNLKRGLLLAVVAVGMSAVLWFWMPDNMIWFGVLHCLACCILLFAVAGRGVFRAPTWPSIAVCAVLFVLTCHVPLTDGGYLGIDGIFTVAVPNLGAWGYPFGLGYLASEDYFPLIPWIFVFWIGAFLGKAVSRRRLPAWAYRHHIRPLSFLGRHALVIYLAHQPVIFGTAWLIGAVIEKCT